MSGSGRGRSELEPSRFELAAQHLRVCDDMIESSFVESRSLLPNGAPLFVSFVRDDFLIEKFVDSDK